MFCKNKISITIKKALKSKSMEQKIDLSIIIVSWNVKEYLENCLSSIFSNLKNDLDYEIIVVDNASSDNAVPELRIKFPQVQFIVNKENLGFGKANNQGFKKSRGEIIFFLNPDTLIKNKAIQKLVEFIKKTPNIGILGPRVLWPNGLIQLSWIGRIDKESRPAQSRGQPLTCLLERIFHTKKFRLTKPIRIAGIHGMAMMIKREVFEKLKGFDQDLFLNFEAADLCLRSKEKGYDNYFFPGSEIIHFSGRSKAQQSRWFNIFHHLKSGAQVIIKKIKQ